jgi:large subunit ribosomal protein L4
MRKAALRSALASKALDGCIWVLYDWSETSTKLAASTLGQQGIEGRTLLVLDPEDEASAAVDRAFRNLRHAAFTLVGSLSAYDVLVADAIVFTKEAFEKYTSTKNEEAS